MYSKCRNIEAAFQVFTDIEDHTVISWTSIVMGLAKHGFATGALKMFQEMLKTGIKPNEVTYIAVLSACSHVGMINEGWKHFNAMYEEHGISPRMEHYACMVDLLGRSGFLEEAIQFINSMPFMADALVWRTLLGACQGHGQWDEVVRIRKNMKERNLVKEAGCSWIETENKVYKFHVGDTSHPQAREIYEELDQLSLKIKELGYVPNTNFVLHDVEEEQKQQYLFQHNEKIAVAFGLISTSKSKPIRVFKNLRVCGDCHTAMKYISIATGREIVLRDSNRFHHFKGGACPCNDYL
ncbi:Pentatricopeptide repeat-containing protein [Camellia lanceoleosa]|uniref:Pentatricopeptide repeat-containing protein n=1 Tax=Camellia lanceoleosa TaxID=1840588 RepID=A0ACC0IXX7_9ERIC|nr:Pentatricopeptide repeat-containing protein [Camellia lanceoleosa]